jgi:hypothetical protein
MIEELFARVHGRVHDVRGGGLIETDGLTMTWVRARDGEIVVKGLPVKENGIYDLKEIEAEELYVVYINDILGIPAAVIPEEGNNKQAFYWSAMSSNAPITGEVWAYDGTTHLPGVQHFGLWDAQLTEWAWPSSSPTKDMGDWQAPPDGCEVPGGRTYGIVINYGPGFEGDTDNSQLYVPTGGVNGEFRRNTGTANVLLVGASDGNDRMRLLGETDSYLFKPANDPGRRLVSLPCSKGYTAKAKRLAVPPDPPPDLTQCPSPPTQPWTMPSIPGGGSQNVDFTKPW